MMGMDGMGYGMGMVWKWGWDGGWVRDSASVLRGLMA